MASETRTYRSELRRRQAGETRRRVLAAASDLFADLGYERTTLRAIAKLAKVSLETVQVHGPKPALLRGAIELAGFGVEGADNVTDLEPGQALMGVERDQLSALLSEFLADLHAAIAPLYEALIGGAAGNPELAEYYADIVASIRRQWRETHAEMGRRGWLATDGTAPSVDEWALLASPETYLHLVHRFGWSKGEYSRWLQSQFERCLT